MAVTVRYFASLKEALGCGEQRLACAGGLTAQAVWERLNGGRPPPANVLVAVNMEYAAMDTQVNDGDEVAFFPPVSGGAP